MSERQPRQRRGKRLDFDRARARALFDTTVRELWRDNALGTSAEIAFFYSFAIPPLMVFLVILAAIVNEQTNIGIVDGLRAIINDHAPTDTQPAFNSLIDRALERVSNGVASLAVISALAVSLWSISNAVATLTRVLNRAYDLEDDRSFLQRRLLSFGLAILVALTVSPAIILFFFGNYLGTFLTDQFGLGRPFEIFWLVARWPLAVAFIIVQLAVLYYILPNLEQSFRWTSAGSLVATGLWLIGAMGFRLFLELSDPASLYGAFGSLLMLLAFLYMTGFSVLVGAEVNAIIAHNYDPEAEADLARHKKSEPDSNRVRRGLQKA